MSREKTDAGSQALKLRIMDNQVQIACRPGDEDALLEAAAYIDHSMRELRKRNTNSSIEKIAIVTAINTAHSLLKSRSEQSAGAPADDGSAGSDEHVTARLAAMTARLEEVLEPGGRQTVERESSHD